MSKEKNNKCLIQFIIFLEDLNITFLKFIFNFLIKLIYLF